MKRFTLITASAALAASTAFAAQDMSDADPAMNPDTISLSRVLGAEVFTTNLEFDTTDWASAGAYYEINTAREEIAEIVDVVMTRQGELVGLVAELGGVLDIGDTHVMIKMEDLKFVPPGDDAEVSYVTRLTTEEMKELPKVTEGSHHWQ
jgi:hypothetical protein